MATTTATTTTATKPATFAAVLASNIAPVPVAAAVSAAPAASASAPISFVVDAPNSSDAPEETAAGPGAQFILDLFEEQQPLEVTEIITEMLAITDADLQKVTAQWTRNKIRYDMWVAPFFWAAPPRICTRLNHCAGFGCSKSDCTYIHQCMLCKSSEHGAFQRDEEDNYMCPHTQALYDAILSIGKGFKNGYDLFTNLVESVRYGVEPKEFWNTWADQTLRQKEQKARLEQIRAQRAKKAAPVAPQQQLHEVEEVVEVPKNTKPVVIEPIKKKKIDIQKSKKAK